MAYLTYAERRVIGWIQQRQGPCRVGPFGLWQPFADAIKLVFKQGFTPDKAAPFLYHLAPLICFSTAMMVWGFLPVHSHAIVVDSEYGLLWVLVLSSLGVYGLLIAGWASNSKYALLGGLRSAAQVLSYELALGFVYLSVIALSGSFNIKDIIMAQQGGFWNWNGVRYFPLLVLYMVCLLAETNRAPFDMAEGESEIVAGYHVEYGSWSFALFFLAEYIHMIVGSVIGAFLFLGGYLAPLPVSFFYVSGLQAILWQVATDSFFIAIKVAIFLFMFIWVRATLPRYRYDQLMLLGWQRLIPLSCLLFTIIAIASYNPRGVLCV
jgi:NADH-quinone oxidoreductase subunit H